MSSTTFVPHTLPERYTTYTTREMEERIKEIKSRLGERLVILAHHYQRDEVFQFADYTGDSLKLAQLAAKEKDAEAILFCGVHFMAETADLLTAEDQIVVLPDLKAGCSMADMADDEQVEECWDVLTELYGESLLPVTYVNSTAAIKAFCGRQGGLTCTSSNAPDIFRWAFDRKERILFLPDEHLGRNTAVQLGIGLDEMAVYNPHTRRLEGVENDLERIKVILWKGFCSVHQHFTLDHVERIRQMEPSTKILVHPECSYEVVNAADLSGSTEFIISQVKQAAPGTSWAIGTEVNLVQRLAKDHPEQRIKLLNDMICPCLTMNRIDLPHLLWALETIEQDEVTNIIRVEGEEADQARLALERMLTLSRQ